MQQIQGYQDNLTRLCAFYQSDFYQYLQQNDPLFIEDIVGTLCVDGDKSDLSALSSFR
ncbi:hypothetical protein MOO45_06300 [Bombilactobacillus folatiphilus]|uniref:Uncharacterized protein n=1 Tax=Bombilactobacillus folatiphilus TaxID=2923362 RepID=A0ABY4P8G9_9LACO|nr:hypothetical protein [Bombilactobacillus folatiphilus]UQS81811.1 hypothetical protein MOO45_06300 [Bombilactobacillus folatiphilus]